MKSKTLVSLLIMLFVISCNKGNLRNTADNAINSNKSPETSQITVNTYESFKVLQDNGNQPWGKWNEYESFKVLQDNGNQPWGKWNEEVTKNVKIKIYEGEFYADGYGDCSTGFYITQDHQNSHIPVFHIPGDNFRILRYERNEEGLLFYILGQGRISNPSGFPSFKDDFEGQIQMIFLSKNESQFIFKDVIDEEGYRMSKFLKENFTYYRLPVEP
jgi:hypothetical protein